MHPDGRWASTVAAVAVGLAALISGAWSLSATEPGRTTNIDPRVHPRVDEVPVASEATEPIVGRYREAPLDEAGQLAVIGYTSGSREAGSAAAVTINSDEAYAGLNLYTSGHEPVAVLMDMDGTERWRWHLSFDAVWPDWKGPKTEHNQFWRRVHLLEDGSLLAIFEGIGLVKLDRDSNLLWARPNAAHHDLEVLDDGTIWVLSRRSEILEELESDGRSVVDYVLRLDAEGREIDRINLMTAYANSRFKAHFVPEASRGGDSFHTNTLHVVKENGPSPFAKGRILLSMRHLDALALLDPRSRRMVWSASGDSRNQWEGVGFRRQHDPQILDNGNLLLFDNGPEEGSSSRVLELPPGPGAAAWIYAGTEEEPFWSRTCGTAQRLPNGNTLITESDGGRALEVTRSGEIVWEFHNPARPEDDPSLVATLFEMRRLPLDFPTEWMEPEVEE